MQKVKHRLSCSPRTGEAGGGNGVGGSVVLLRLLPFGHPVFLAPARQEAAGLVALLLPDPHRVVLGHDPVVAGPLEEVALRGEREGRGSAWGRRGSAWGRRDPRAGREKRQKGAAVLEPLGETPRSPLYPIGTYRTWQEK